MRSSVSLPRVRVSTTNRALSLWEERERTRAEILAAVDKAEDSLARGEGRTITGKSMRELAESVKQRGRARLSRKLNPTSG